MSLPNVVFLDRDGTINIDTGYLSQPEEVVLIPGVGKALGDLVRAGFSLSMVTNQSGIGRGYYSKEEFLRVNDRVVELLLEEDREARFDSIFFCPHSPTDNCLCRKPKAGMVKAEFAQSESFVVGDKASDLGLGRTLGLPESNLILVGPDSSLRLDSFPNASYCASLVEASELIISSSRAVKAGSKK